MAFPWLINGGDPNHLQVLGWSSKYQPGNREVKNLLEKICPPKCLVDAMLMLMEALTEKCPKESVSVFISNYRTNLPESGSQKFCLPSGGGWVHVVAADYLDRLKKWTHSFHQNFLFLSETATLSLKKCDQKHYLSQHFEVFVSWSIAALLAVAAVKCSGFLLHLAVLPSCAPFCWYWFNHQPPIFSWKISIFFIFNHWFHSVFPWYLKFGAHEFISPTSQPMLENLDSIVISTNLFASNLKGTTPEDHPRFFISLRLDQTSIRIVLLCLDCFHFLVLVRPFSQILGCPRKLGSMVRGSYPNVYLYIYIYIYMYIIFIPFTSRL